jgi:mRNA-degrading endonuclease toxin of MazEF toxin-antitoxin module
MVQKVRPAVVLSVQYQDHERALVTYVSRTTSLRSSRFEVAHVGRGFLPGAFDAQSIGTVPSVKLVRRIVNSTTKRCQKWKTLSEAGWIFDCR